MRISDILSESMVIADACAATKEDLLRCLAGRLCEHPQVATSAEQILAGLMNRESLGSTGVGDGVAIPHAKIPGLSLLVAAFCRATDGVPFDSIDEKPAQLVFVLLVPENSAGAHLKALARISRLLRQPSFRERLLQSADNASIYEAFISEDGP